MGKNMSFDELNNDDSDLEEELDTRNLVEKQNMKKKKSGGFQSMGLSNAIYKGIMKRGYKVPTPIQRKCIPVIMEKRDVVAMARTGSGKTAAFLIPMFQRLQVHSAAGSARCLIISPTRELALQTLKFTVQLGKFTNLRAVAILGGDRMDDQFAALHEHPDIIIATPGRFLHVVVEMDLKLREVEYVVFDEADRLFEMGLLQQLREIINRLPESRQTLLFSATLPKLLVDFVKAGLDDPVLIRLDVENKLSDNLTTAYLSCCSDEKLGVLLHLLKNVAKPKELTMVFLATKHHIEYVHMILEKAGVKSTYIYSSLDQTARNRNVLQFRNKKVPIILVTDLAARGIDIPLLDNVINYHFPAKSKLFVHRAGRVARAGRLGTAYSLVVPDEMPYLLDLHLFLGKPLQIASQASDVSDSNGILGTVPRVIIDECDESLQLWHQSSIDLVNMKKVCDNAYKQYLKSRPLPSTESVKRMKDELKLVRIATHPMFSNIISETEKSRMLESMKSYKPQATIFEIHSTTKNFSNSVIKKVREKHELAINKYQHKLKEQAKIRQQTDTPSLEQKNMADEKDIQRVFSCVVAPKKGNNQRLFKPKKRKKASVTTDFKDKEYYISYKPKDHYSEQGLGLEKPSFSHQANSVVMDFTGDDVEDIYKRSKKVKWDRKKKKFVNDSGKEQVVKKIKTESGVWIPASYKSNLYKKWQNKSKIDKAAGSEEDYDEEDKHCDSNTPSLNKLMIPKRWRNNIRPKKSENNGRGRREMKTADEILKFRRIKERRRKFHEQRRIKNLRRRV